MGNKSSKTSFKGTLRILLLGVSGSGKSTFTKQMKILHLGGFSDEERCNYKTILRSNILVGMREYIKQAEKLELSLLEKNRRRARFFTETQTLDADNAVWDDKLKKRLQQLWEDPSIQQLHKDAGLYQLQIHHMEYMMTHLDRICNVSFEPTIHDILLARQRTAGTNSIQFVKEKYKWELVDVGGQIPERAKWAKLLKEGVTALIFFVGLDEYNMLSGEDKTRTKMQVSMDVFQDVMSSENITNTCCLLFLNKIDLLENKVNDKKHFRDFKKTFDDYKGPQEPGAVSKFLEKKFLDLVPKERNVRPFIVCALDTDMMKTIFEAVKESIFSKAMEQFFQ